MKIRLLLPIVGDRFGRRLSLGVLNLFPYEILSNVQTRPY